MRAGPHLYLVIFTAVFLAVCCVSDVRTRQIPNRLTASGAFLGVLANCFFFGAQGIAQSTVGMALALAILLPPFAFGGIGGGDVKMMAAVGALVGPPLVLSALVLGMIAGGFVAVFTVARQGALWGTLRRMFRMLRGAVAQRSTAPLRVSAEAPGAITLPYSVPLAIGTGASLALSVVQTWTGASV